MIEIIGPNSPENPFHLQNGRIIREFAPHIPSLDELKRLWRASTTDPNQEYARQFNEGRREYVKRWFGADADTRAQMAAEEEDGGRLTIRTGTYISSFGGFQDIVGALIEDAMNFKPPVVIDEHAIEVMHYAGQHYKGTYGFEVTLPESVGIIVPPSFSRVIQGEWTL